MPKFFSLKNILSIIAIVAAIVITAVPAFRNHRLTQHAAQCCDQLQQIQAAKDQWEIETKASKDTPCDLATLIAPSAFLKKVPVCPEGGTYAANTLAEKATCSVGEHKSAPRYSHVILQRPE